jgi:hypothetical protein
MSLTGNSRPNRSPVGAGLQPAQMGTWSRGNPVWMSAAAEEPQR